jgi:heavy metal sensor kinase
VILTLRSRLTLVYTGVFGVLLIAIAAVSYQVLAYQLDADVSATLEDLTSGLHGYLRFGAGVPTLTYDPADPEQAAFVNEATRYFQVFDAASGDRLVRSDALGPLRLDLTPGEVRRLVERPAPFDVQTDYGRVRFSNSVLESPAGRRALLQVGVSLEPMDNVLRRFLALLAVSVPVGLSTAMLLGRWTARVALRPLSDLAEAARAIDIEGLRRRLPLRGARDELDAVAGAFNQTLSRLEHTVGEMRQFSAALAHELRTPLAALRGDIELALLQPGNDESVQRRFASQLEEIDKLSGLIERILLLARAEAGEIVITLGTIDLGEVVGSLVDQVEPVAKAKGLDLQFERAGPATVHADANWLERLFLNLLDNAIKFTPAGGRVRVTVACEGTEARLAVQDTGVGMDPTVVPYVFERFFRADPARSSGAAGAGLGLSLVKWVVDRHHGRIEVESQPGHGSTFTVVLPALPPPGR